MIIYVAKGRYLATLGAYLTSHHAESIGKRIHLLSYRALFAAKRLPVATYIFTDHDRLTAAECERAWGVCQALQAGSPLVRILNHPARVMLRLEMLRALHRDGINSFQAYPLIGAERPTEFPVFLRSEGEHGGERSELIDNAEDLAAEIPKYLRRRRYKRGYGSVIVGFVDSKDAQGRALKYSAFRVGDHIIPRHRFLGRTWFVRGPDHLDEDTAGAELAWLGAFAEADQVHRIFDIAGIDYGRLDFAIIDGRVQAFEINTNPQTIGARQDPLRQKADDFFGPRFTGALAELDGTEDGWVVNDMPLTRRALLPMSLTMRLEDARWRHRARRESARFQRQMRRAQRRNER
ncbi:MAG: hypothetical protein AAGG65_19005 [Pseudomonadota bacterium]